MVAWPFVVTDRPGTDAVSYISIAESWAEGRWGDALNAYWSPLLSWLLVPAAWIGAPMFPAALAVSVAIGAFVMWQLRALAEAVGVGPSISASLALAAIPFVLHAAYGLLSPDLLVAALLLGYLTELARVDGDGIEAPAANPRRGWRIGAWASLAFLAKFFALPFVVAHLVVWSIARRARRRPEDAGLGVAGRTAAVVGVVVLAWSVPLSISYGAPTVSTTVTYHLAVADPASPGNAFWWAGLLEPPNPSAVSAWEEPSRFPYRYSSVEVGAGDGVPFDGELPAPAGEVTPSGSSVDRVMSPDTRADRLVRNARRAAGSVTSIVGAAIVGSVAALAVIVTARRRASRPIEHVVTAAMVYTGGVIVSFVERRYLFFVLLLAVVLAGWALERARARGGRRRLVAWSTAIVAITTVPGSVLALTRVAERAEHASSIGVEDARYVTPGDRVASTGVRLERFAGTCSRVGCAYLGAPLASDDPAAVLAELEEAGIDVVFVLEDPIELPPPARRATGAPPGVLAVYRIGEG
ncbi:hypothetical protein [Ilumatobacter sp.]|uniref:hypothetical protein n=1 Tax=Ilumatobacter sp. TaxID=1967498 RepID=UPI003B51C5B8